LPKRKLLKLFRSYGSMKSTVDIISLIDEINDFVRERDWEQYHSPKNLAISLSIEANELLEHFQWKNPTFDKIKGDGEEIKEVSHEIADMLIYLLRFIHKLDLDFEDIVRSKIKLNKRKYPADLCKGKADKYNHYY